MNLNSITNYAQVPVADIRRSKFDINWSHLTTFDAGKLYPILCEQVYPGDSVKLDMNVICRMATPLAPVMDNCYMDVHFFFVPFRLLWDHWKNFMGESTTKWTSGISYAVPMATYTPTQGSLFDYFGEPIGVTLKGSDLPYRAYNLIWNEWYRDEALQDPLLVSTGDTANPSMSRQLLPVNKYKDYFTSCLPSPQKGDPVTISLGEYAKVYARSDTVTDALFAPAMQLYNYGMVTDSNAHSLVSENGSLNTEISPASGGVSRVATTPLNLWADLSDASGIDVNSLRLAFAIQRMFETDARGGTRYRELVKAHFGVDVGDSRVQVPEYLGGKHIPINVMQVVQQSGTVNEPTPIGTTGAFSKTFDTASYVDKSFVEHGLLMGFVSIRTDHTYQQGQRRQMRLRDKYDFYWPELAHIGEQPVYQSEIYATTGNTLDGGDQNAVFGYQEAWAHLRSIPNQVTGNFRSNATDSLDIWHYADDYDQLPFLSDAWIRETDVNVNRTLVVQNSETQDQFFAQFFFVSTWIRPLPTFSIPGVGGRM